MNRFQEAWNKMLDKLDGWLNDLVVMLPNLIIAAIVMIISIFLSRYVNKYARKIIEQITSNRTVSNVLSSVATAIFLILMLFMVLGILNLDKALTSLLAGAGVVGLAIGLALQDPLVNLFSGVMMSVRVLFKVGDLVETNGYFGRIRQIDLRSTILKTPSGELVTIPNKKVLQDPLTNYTIEGKRRVTVECGISYGEDLKTVKDLVLEAMKNVSNNDGDQVEFYYTEFDNSSIIFMVRFWRYADAQSSMLEAKSEAMMAIKTIFDENDITIPFPIRTLDFGIKGGERLDEMLGSEKFSVEQHPSNNR